MGYTTAISKRSQKAVGALVCGLLGMFICGLIGIAGITQGLAARREIEASRGTLHGNGMATAGIVLGIIGLAQMALFSLRFTLR